MRDWLLALAVGLAVALAFFAGTRMLPRPITPTATQAVQAQCRIETRAVRDSLEQIRQTINARHQRRLTYPQAEQRTTTGLSQVAAAVRAQRVTCRIVRP